jgi:hypothetical protein
MVAVQPLVTYIIACAEDNGCAINANTFIWKQASVGPFSAIEAEFINTHKTQIENAIEAKYDNDFTVALFGVHRYRKTNVYHGTLSILNKRQAGQQPLGQI